MQNHTSISAATAAAKGHPTVAGAMVGTAWRGQGACRSQRRLSCASEPRCGRQAACTSSWRASLHGHLLCWRTARLWQPGTARCSRGSCLGSCCRPGQLLPTHGRQTAARESRPMPTRCGLPLLICFMHSLCLSSMHVLKGRTRPGDILPINNDSSAGSQAQLRQHWRIRATQCGNLLLRCAS